MHVATEPSTAHNFIIHFLIRRFLFYRIIILYQKYIQNASGTVRQQRNGTCNKQRNTHTHTNAHTQFSWSNLFAFIDIGCELETMEMEEREYSIKLFDVFVAEFHRKYLLAVFDGNDNEGKPQTWMSVTTTVTV